MSTQLSFLEEMAEYSTYKVILDLQGTTYVRAKNEEEAKHIVRSSSKNLIGITDIVDVVKIEKAEPFCG